MDESIFDHRPRPGRVCVSAQRSGAGVDVERPSRIGALRRTGRRGLPEVSELQAVRHYTNLSRRNFSIDNQFYPLGSCTMKYNPRGAHRIASLPGFAGRHPLAELPASQGFLACLHELQEVLKAATGMAAVSAAPMAGAQGEFAGIAMIRAYHDAQGDTERREIIVPDAAHGTNPASAVMCGYVAREVPVGADGDVDFEALKAAVGEQTAGIMLTNPSTCGVFERRIADIADVVHDAGGLLYYDGANLNAVLGQGPPRRHGVRRPAPEPAQDVRDAPRRRRARRGAGGSRTSAWRPTCPRRSSEKERPMAIDGRSLPTTPTPSDGFPPSCRQRGHPAARPGLRPHARAATACAAWASSRH